MAAAYRKAFTTSGHRARRQNSARHRSFLPNASKWPSRLIRTRPGNSMRIEPALGAGAATGYEVLPDDVTRLSPLSFKHINMLGRYASTCQRPSLEANSDRCAIQAPPAWTKLDALRHKSDPLCRFSVPLLLRPQS
jgi:hypothetical protein